MKERLSQMALGAILLLGALAIGILTAAALFAAVYLYLATQIAPYLAALVGAALLLVLAIGLGWGGLDLARGRRRGAADSAAGGGGDPLLELGRLSGKLTRENAPQATALAFGVGVVLGLKPKLRARVLNSLRD